MAQIYKPTDTLSSQFSGVTGSAVTTEDTTYATSYQDIASSTSSGYTHAFTPSRRLGPSPANPAVYGTGPSFDALAADIPDAFTTYEKPKMSFLFTVEFFPRTGSNISLPTNGAESMDDMKFALKRAGRPNPSITYEDVNFYGLRQKVGIKTDYGTIDLTFYDDVVNRAHSIVTQYLNAVSPISLKTAINADNLAGSAGGAISYGALQHVNGPFQYMRVTHFMLGGDGSSAAIQKRKVYYDYLNPKITAISLDDLDMEVSAVNNVLLTFNYDSVNISYE